MNLYRNIFVLFFVALVLSGCISRRSDINLTVTPETPGVAQQTLDDGNSRYVSEPSADFSLRLPNDMALTKDLDEGGAKLF